MPAYHESAHYAFHVLRVGSTIIRKADNASVYFQPGDDTAIAIDTVDALSEIPADRADVIFDMWCGEFTAHFDSHAAFVRANDLKR